MNKPANYDKQLSYYTGRYDEVRAVTCVKCGAAIAFEVKGGVDNAGNQTHHEGFDVIPVNWAEYPQGMALLSWRARLDGQTGYQCGALIKNPDYDKAVKSRDTEYKKALADFSAEHKGKRKDKRPPEPVKADVNVNEFSYCGNSTILAQVERGEVPVGSGAPGVAPTLSPFEREELTTSIRLSGNKPDVEVKGKITRVETFKVERIK